MLNEEYILGIQVIDFDKNKYNFSPLCDLNSMQGMKDPKNECGTECNEGMTGVGLQSQNCHMSKPKHVKLNLFESLNVTVIVVINEV